MPDDTQRRPRLSAEERLVMRETEIDILLANIARDRGRITRLRNTLQQIAANRFAESHALSDIAADALELDNGLRC
jgi:hypothetical protein